MKFIVTNYNKSQNATPYLHQSKAYTSLNFKKTVSGCSNMRNTGSNMKTYLICFQNGTTSASVEDEELS